MLTMSGLLNALDGVASAEERIIFMTTNYIERLDPALIRPGRVDFRQNIDYASIYQVKCLFTRFYGVENEELANEFRDLVSSFGKSVSTAQLQGHFVLYKDDPRNAVDNAKDLLK